jgi:hypothetical protein
MIECLQLRGLSERNQESYVRAVRQLAQHYHKSPDLISEEELRQYFLYLKNVKHYARPTTTNAICGIRFFFERTLGKDWTTFNLVRERAPARACLAPTSEGNPSFVHVLNNPTFTRSTATRRLTAVRRSGPARPGRPPGAR